MSNSVVSPAVAGAGRSPRTMLQRTRGSVWVRALFASKTTIIGSVVLLLWVLIALFWPLIVPYDPQTSFPHVLAPPSAEHWFGTDQLGRDVFSRVLAGSAPVLQVAPAATVLSVGCGTLIGLATGYFGGVLDDVAMRLVDALLAFPVIVTGLFVLAIVGPSETAVILAIAVIFTPIVARTVRASVLAERELDYVTAARLRGERHLRVMLAEILPNVTGPIAVEATIRLGFAVFVESSLSFLGLGIPQPSPDWGLSVALARPTVQVAPWAAIFPAIAIATLVVSVFLIVDGMRQTTEEQ